jgi:hypothetical protein
MVLAVLLALAPVITLADVLILDEVKQADSMNLPGNGQSKAVIESTYGAPTQKHAAVGDPPITRWDYDSFSVYFEYDLVLSTVLQPGAVITGS